jgi:hypothetical protein
MTGGVFVLVLSWHSNPGLVASEIGMRQPGTTSQ